MSFFVKIKFKKYKFFFLESYEIQQQQFQNQQHQLQTQQAPPSVNMNPLSNKGLDVLILDFNFFLFKQIY